MCYSAMIYSDLKKLGFLMKARVDLSLFESLFQEQEQTAAIRVSREFELYFSQASTPEEVRIKELIEVRNKKEMSEKEKSLFQFKKRLNEANQKLAVKITKSTEKEKGIAERGIENTLKRMEILRSTDSLLSDHRIFPYYYAPVIIWRDGEKVIVPMRYLLRPAGMPESFDQKYPGCYNARIDSLNGFWKNQFGKHHAILIISSFYENVKKHIYEHRDLKPEEKEENKVIHFSPEEAEYMIVPCIWDQWPAENNPKLTSFALITDDPPSEIAETGHDRCPIFLKEKNINQWLNPLSSSKEDLLALLKDRNTPFYQHSIAA